MITNATSATIITQVTHCPVCRVSVFTTGSCNRAPHPGLGQAVKGLGAPHTLQPKKTDRTFLNWMISLTNIWPFEQFEHLKSACDRVREHFGQVARHSVLNFVAFRRAGNILLFNPS
jgi:hypothetical protein